MREAFPGNPVELCKYAVYPSVSVPSPQCPNSQRTLPYISDVYPCTCMGKLCQTHARRNFGKPSVRYPSEGYNSQTRCDWLVMRTAPPSRWTHATSLKHPLLLALAASLAFAQSEQDGLKVEVTTPASCIHTAVNGDVVAMHYNGTLIDGTKFDSSRDRGVPFTFTLGMGQVIKGWDQGLLGMCPGEERRLTIPPSLGYGDQDMGSIPPGSTLVFETLLLTILGVDEEALEAAAAAAEAEKPDVEDVSLPGDAGFTPFESDEGLDSGPVSTAGSENGECKLLGPFALLVQAALGILALSSLVFKRWRERPRRPLKIWFFDASKQVFGSALLHVFNVFMSMLSSGSIELANAAGKYSHDANPCSFYLINIAVDTTIGIPILVLLLKVLTQAALITPLANPPESVKSGYYGEPPKAVWWLKQSMIYFVALLLMKLCVFFIFEMLPWIVWVGNWALRWTEGSEALQIAFVMFVFPLIMNAIQYYIVDTFIKDRSSSPHGHEAVATEDDDDTAHVDHRLHEDESDDEQDSSFRISHESEDNDKDHSARAREYTGSYERGARCVLAVTQRRQATSATEKPQAKHYVACALLTRHFQHDCNPKRKPKALSIGVKPERAPAFTMERSECGIALETTDAAGTFRISHALDFQEIIVESPNKHETMALELHIPHCIHSPAHPHHMPPEEKPLRVQIEGLLVSIKKLIPGTEGHVEVRNRVFPHAAGPVLARLAFEKVYGRHPRPREVPGDLTIRDDQIDYYGVTFDHLVPTDDVDPEVLQINIVEMDDDEGAYANETLPFKVDPAAYTGRRVLAVPRCCQKRKGTTDRVRINDGVAAQDALAHSHWQKLTRRPWRTRGSRRNEEPRTWGQVLAVLVVPNPRGARGAQPELWNGAGSASSKLVNRHAALLTSAGETDKGLKWIWDYQASPDPGSQELQTGSTITVRAIPRRCPANRMQQSVVAKGRHDSAVPKPRPSQSCNRSPRVLNFTTAAMSYTSSGAPAVFNGTDDGQGGNADLTNLNQWYQSGDQAYIIIASAMVLVMVPGLGFLYSGLARRKSALSMVWACLMSMSVITFQWYFWGYSLAFSPSNNGFIGTLSEFGLMNTLAIPSPGSPLIPTLLYSFYQMQFCAVTAAIVMGAIAERGRLVPAMVFTFFWATIVYCPLACWAWNVNGWGFVWGVADYAGGGPVEIGSGLSALAYSMVLGRRQEKMMLNFRPHNVSLITLGTILLWFGWLGFNGGSAFGANLRAVMACWNSNLTAAFASITWVILDWRLARKWSMVGWCSGAISGLVAATPASGYVTPWGSVILGIVTGIVCNFATKIKYWIRIDDSMDVFAEHGIAGMLGLLANALFGASYIVGLDGVNVGYADIGWIQQNWKQLYIQFAYIVACSAYAFGVSAILAFIINKIPGLKLRVSEEAELLGTDDDQLGEFAYDYVEVRRDYLAWTPASKGASADPDVAAGDRHGIPAHSQMLEGKEPSDSSSGNYHPVAAGDRHGIAYEKVEQEHRSAAAAAQASTQ
ncbi:hypothetical protein FH972_023268 [Carpinus fangiana]|uniref:peptidylprolyl isomerase n=1 Tax=Carpinus fangiana TaxID=176857 RepID=A0A5N6KV66_9ROSI|nr:hypothetical protein FH972_023268 [Carpinus fangiana]